MPKSITIAAICVIPCLTLDRVVAEEPETTRTMNVAIVVHDGVELLDFAGPAEVFEAAARQAQSGGVRWYNVYTVAPTSDTIVSQGFLDVVPDYNIENCPAPDILVIPGGNTGKLQNDKAFMQWVKKTAPKLDVLMTVCTGAMVPAELGLLDGLDVTTHWSAINRLRNVAPKAHVHENRRFIDNGQVITTAGISAGIDGALHVAARMLGVEAARGTARYMEYNWTPESEYAKSYARWNPRLDKVGQLAQQADQLRQNEQWSAAADVYRKVVALNEEDARSWYFLGYSLHFAGDLDEAIKAHKRAGSFTDSPFRRNALYNAACAYALKGDKDQSLDALNIAVEAGMRDASWMRRDADLKSLRGDSRFEAILSTLESTQINE